MSKNKTFKYILFIFLFFFLHIHTVFAVGNSSGGTFGNTTKTTTIPAESLQELGQKEVIASSYELGYFYFGQNETVLKERERKFNSIFYHNTPMNCLPLSFQDVT